MEYGLSQDKNGDIYFNPNQFMAKFLSTEGKDIVKDLLTKRYYEYIENLGIYVTIDLEELKSDLMFYFNSIAADGWKVGYENQYMPVFHNLVPRVNDFDKAINIIVFSNHCYDIRRKRIRPHNKEWHRTVNIPFEHDEKATCPLFDRYIKDISCDDKILEDTLEELLGYMLYPGNSAHKMIIFLGEGSNSKSTFMTLLKQLVGTQNTSAVPLKDFERPFTRHSLKDKILNLVPEGEFLKADTLIPGIVKQYITGDEVSAEIKGGDTYTYRPNIKIIMALNQLPVSVSDTTSAIKRRLLILPFQANFAGKNLDRKMGEKLLKEMSGIINRALKGLERLEKNDFTFSYEPQSMAVIDEIFMISKPLHYFAGRYIFPKEGTRLAYRAAYDKYDRWCLQQGIQNTYTQRHFTTKLKKILLSRNVKIETFASNGKKGLEDIECQYE